MKTYFIIDPELDFTVETSDVQYVTDYVQDDFCSKEPVTVLTVENGQVIDCITYDPALIGHCANNFHTTTKH